MSLGSVMQQNVRLLLKDMGYNMTLRRELSGTYDPDTGTTTGATTSDETVRAVIVQFKERDFKAEINFDRDGQFLQRGDRLAYIATVNSNGDDLEKEPEIGDKLIGKRGEVTIFISQPVIANDTVVVYKCGVRE